MKSYPLLRPDGETSGVWACGACDRPHIAVLGATAAASDASRERAEACCVPKICGFCGEPTERDVVGAYPAFHDHCFRKARGPELSHPSMDDPWARLLRLRMSEISEDTFAAGWYIGLEYLLWQALEEGEEAPLTLSAREADELRVLRDQAGGWIWTGDEDEYVPRLVDFAEWRRRYAARR